MSDIDVRGLASSELPSGKFPVDPNTEFRLFIAPDVHRGISQHAHADPAVEICGVLVGIWERDAHGPYAVVENFIRCESATSKFAEVTFTHESWAQINQEMDTRFDDKRIVGWYHSHPDFGIFLSDRDCFIHEHFFSGPGQVAYVVDPVRDLEGAFAWKQGKPTLLPHYWVGDTIRTIQASVRSAATDAKNSPGEASADSGLEPRRLAADPYGLSTATTLLSCLALFLMGYLLASWRTNWERQAIVDGVVSNYTQFKLLKIGLGDELNEVQRFLGRMASELEKMPAPNEKLSPEQAEEQLKTRKLLENNLAGIQQRLSRISERYEFSEDEKYALARYAQELDRQRRQLQEQAEAAKKSEKSTPPKSDAADEPAQPPATESQKPSQE